MTVTSACEVKAVEDDEGCRVSSGIPARVAMNRMRA